MRRPQIVFGVTVLTLGILSAILDVPATEPPEVDAKSNTTEVAFAHDADLSLRLPLRTGENLSLGAVTESPTGEPSASELNRQLTNPVSSIWSIANQFNNFELNNGHWNNNRNFQA